MLRIILYCVLIFPIIGFFFLRELPADNVPPPHFSHDGGQYVEPFELIIASGEDSEVFYTTDGSIPDAASGTEYTDPVFIDKTVVIRARAYRQDGGVSEVVSKVYTKLDEDVASFNSDLPLVIMHQFDVPIVPSVRTPAYITIIDHNQGERTWLAGDVDLQSRIQTNIRGSSSQQFPKKQYAVRLVDDNDENRNEEVLGMPSENNWILHAPYDDKTLMRNAIAYRLSRDMGWYAPRTRFVEVFLHEGSGPVTGEHYHGVYMMVERIKWDNNRVDIDKVTPDDNSEPGITGGYIIQNDRDVHITTARGSEFACVRPQDWDITDKQRQWLIGYLDDFEETLFGSGFNDPETGYRSFINTDSFIDHHLITELSKEIDGYRLSTFMYKDREGKLTMGPLWDFNLSFGNANYLTGDDSEGWYYERISNEQYLYGWYTRFFQDPDFERRYIGRWHTLRQTFFSNEYILEIIEQYADLLDEAQERNFERWPILGIYVWPNPDGYDERDTYRKEVDWMIDWVEARLEWMDTQLGEPPPDTLLDFWYFNVDLDNDTPFETLESTYSIDNGGMIEYQSALSGYPFYPGNENWRKSSMERRNRPTALNYRPEGNGGELYDETETRGLQVRQPFTGDAGENTMIFHVSTEGYKNISFSFAAKDEGAADSLIIDYSVEPNSDQWDTTGMTVPVLELQDSYQLYEINFSDAESVDNNPDFRIRIRFDGEDMTADEGERVNFNNIALTGETPVVSVPQPEETTATTYHLEQNFPNPFNPETTIRFSIPEQQNVRLTIYNTLGQQVERLLDTEMKPGKHDIPFDASHLPSGVYIYRIQAGEFVESKKLMVLK